MEAAPHIFKPLYANVFDFLAGGPYEPQRRIFIKDTEGRYLYVNNRFALDAGLQPEEMLGHTDEVMPWRAQANQMREIDLRVLQDGREAQRLEIMVTANGRRLRVMKRKQALYSDSLKPAGLIGSYVPISLRRPSRRGRTEHALDVSLSLLSAIQMASFEEQMEAWDSDRQTGDEAPEPQLF